MLLFWLAMILANSAMITLYTDVKTIWCQLADLLNIAGIVLATLQASFILLTETSEDEQNIDK